jgi:hypothetical protein
MTIEVCRGCFKSTGHRFNSDTMMGICGVCRKKVRFRKDSLLGHGDFPEKHYVRKRNPRLSSVPKGRATRRMGGRRSGRR